MSTIFSFQFLSSVTCDKNIKHPQEPKRLPLHLQHRIQSSFLSFLLLSSKPLLIYASSGCSYLIAVIIILMVFSRTSSNGDQYAEWRSRSVPSADGDRGSAGVHNCCDEEDCMRVALNSLIFGKKIKINHTIQLRNVSLRVLKLYPWDRADELQKLCSEMNCHYFLASSRQFSTPCATFWLSVDSPDFPAPRHVGYQRCIPLIYETVHCLTSTRSAILGNHVSRNIFSVRSSLIPNSNIVDTTASKDVGIR